MEKHQKVKEVGAQVRPRQKGGDAGMVEYTLHTQWDDPEALEVWGEEEEKYSDESLEGYINAYGVEAGTKFYKEQQERTKFIQEYEAAEAAKKAAAAKPQPQPKARSPIQTN